MPSTLKITGQERAQRLSAVDEALASVRLEGLEPSKEAQVIYGLYVEGELNLEQARAEIGAVHDRKYGSVPVPGNERS
jgi:hypothetical protein